MQSSLHLSCSLLLFVFLLFYSSRSLFFHFPFFLLVFLSLPYSQFFIPVFTIIFPTFVLSLFLIFTPIFLFFSLSLSPSSLCSLSSYISHPFTLLFTLFPFFLFSHISFLCLFALFSSSLTFLSCLFALLLLYPESSLFLFLTYSIFSPLSPSRSLSLPSFSPLIP